MLLYIIRALFFVLITAFLFVSVNAPQSRQQQDAQTLIDKAKIAKLQGDLEESVRLYQQADEVRARQIMGSDEVMVVFISGIVVAIAVIAIDWLTPKKSLNVLAGVFFGLLVGVLISWAVAQVIEMMGDLYLREKLSPEALKITKWIVGMCICYLTISMVVQTKDDVRFMIPYVEFSRQTKGLRPLVLDTSVIIDGRIADIAETRLFDAPLIVPRFVLNELQLIADSADKIKRNRGRRGLDMLNRLQTSNVIEVKMDDTPPPGVDENADVDHKLVAFTKNCDGRLVTNDFNLNKVAQLRGVDVINVNDLANALKAVVLPGEPMKIKIIRPGEEANQGIGYLDDGTMVVVDDGRTRIGQLVNISVTSSLQTSAGRMIFGKIESGNTSREQANASGNNSSGRDSGNRRYKPKRS